MKLLAALAMIALAALAVAWLAVHEGATGAENGVLWMIGIGAGAFVLFVIAAFMEAKWYS